MRMMGRMRLRLDRAGAGCDGWVSVSAVAVVAVVSVAEVAVAVSVVAVV